MDKEMPKVSIIIPVYNGANYMREAIHSALSQTYPNVEVIVVNDGSTDNGETERIALSYGSRISYFYKENGGVSTALNLGIEKMNGQYFSWLSHDDIYAPQKIEKQIEILQKVDPSTILYGGYELINENSEKFAAINPGAVYPEDKLNIPLFPLLRGLINGCTLLIHKSHFDRVGQFDTALKSTQDYDLWFKMFRDAKLRFQRGFYVKSRSHPAQGTNTMPKHEEDCSNLWIHMMDNITDSEMCVMDGSIYSFRKNTEKFLRDNTPYTKAIMHAKILLNNAEDKIDQMVKNSIVSVIIPFHNRIPFLIKCIESVLNQSHKNFEVLLVDDGTTDDLSSVRELINKDERIRFFQQSHQGASVARNLGLKEANGDYVAFLDSDDLFVRDKLEIQLKYMVHNGYEFCHTSYQKITVDELPLEVINSGVFAGSVFPRVLSSCGIATPTVMLRRNIINGRRFIEDYLIGEDTCFWIDLASQYSLGGLEQPLSLVRVSPHSAVNNLEKQRLGLQNIACHIIRNPFYLSYERDVFLLLNDLISLFKQTTEADSVAHGSSEDSSLVPYLPKPTSRFRRLFISLGYDGLFVTLRKILYKIKLKLRGL